MTAMVVGAGTGLSAVLFVPLIALIQNVFFISKNATFGFSNTWIFLVAPALGSLLAGPIIAYFAKEAKGHGVS